jgi:hypothetical protein
VARYLNQHWAPLAEVPVHKIGRADVAARLADIAKRNGPFAANRARAALFRPLWLGYRRELVDQNPVVRTRKATEEISRDRILSEEELRSIWQLAGDGEYGAIIRLLILRGQRRMRRRRLRQRTEKGRFADIRQTNDAAFEAHGATLLRLGGRPLPGPSRTRNCGRLFDRYLDAITEKAFPLPRPQQIIQLPRSAWASGPLAKNRTIPAAP